MFRKNSSENNLKFLKNQIIEHNTIDIYYVLYYELSWGYNIRDWSIMVSS